MLKAKSILNQILQDRDEVYSYMSTDIEEAIQEIETFQDTMQISFLLSKATYDKQVKELKIKFIEDIQSLKVVTLW